MSTIDGVCFGLQLSLIFILTGSCVARQMLNDMKLVNSTVGGIAGRAKIITMPDGSQHGVNVFLGIPYAEPPIGSLKFMKPVKKSHLGRFFQADIESKACPQNPAILKAWVPGPGDMSEDCLKLNIYQPIGLCEAIINGLTDSSCPKKAVMVWIHGGAFLIGQSRIYNGERLAAFGDVIVVTINYRLGPLGFLNTGDGVVRGNAGLWDQSEAIAWVHENIACFGGDPSRITVFGESAGAASTVFQTMFPGNYGRIRRIIASSGTALCPWGFSEQSTAKYTLRLAKNLGCVPPGIPGFSVSMHRKMLSCLQGKSYKDIYKNANVGNVNETLFRPEFVPINDGHFIPVLPKDVFTWQPHPPSSITEREILSALSNVDIMVGNNYNDGEAIAKISVRGLLNKIAGVDFDDRLLNISVVDRFYTPQILQDYDMRWKSDHEKALTKINRVYLKGNNLTSNQTSTRDLTLAMILDTTTDYEFLMPTIRTVSSIASFKKSTMPPLASKQYLFIFDQKYPYIPSADWIRHASHGDDLPYIFGFPRSMTEAFHITDEIEKAEWPLSKIVMTYWSNFAKTGNPTIPNKVPTDWKQFDPNDINYLYINGNMTDSHGRHKLFEERIKLWRDTLPAMSHN